MAGEPTISVPAPTVEDEQPVRNTFTLQVVSPSVGVPSPLFFTELPFATTVRELKEKIRNKIEARPTNELQRLIHRGRLLARENETMTEVFGADNLRQATSQTLHLVLRPTNDPPPSQPSPLPANPQAVPRPHSTGPAIHPQPFHSFPPIPGIVPPTGVSNQPINGAPQAGQAVNGPIPVPNQVQIEAFNVIQQLQQNLQQVQQDHQRLQQNLQHGLLTRQLQNNAGIFNPANLPNFHVPPAQAPQGAPGQPQVHIHQSIPSAAPVRTGSAPPLSQNPHLHPHHPHYVPPPGLVPGLAAPQFGTQGQANLPRPGQTTWTRETTGPNGERIHVTVNQTTSFIPNNDLLRGRGTQQPQPLGNIQNILRMADNAAQQGGEGLPSQNASPAPANSQAAAANDIPRPASAPLNRADPANIAANNLRNLSGVPLPSLGASTAPNVSPSPTVYLLSSPTGPRALVLTDAQTYYTPHVRHIAHLPQHPILPIPQASQAQNRGEHTGHHNHQGNQHPPAAQPAAEEEAGGPAVGVAGHPVNPNAGAVAAQMWPHIWLIVRLLGFIWFFTSGNSSWWRWIMISSLAVLFFLINTGLLNGLAEQVFGPVRRHLEMLLPLAGPDGPGAAAVPDNDPALPPAHGLQPQAGGGGAGGAGVAGAPDPAAIARRLIEQRQRANGNWLWTQLRRAEHATLLFLASLVPGVGERHIAAREAEANALAEAERLRAQAQAAAAAAAAAPAATSNSEGGVSGTRAAVGGESGGEEQQASASSTGVEVSSSDQGGARSRDGGAQDREQQPLIEV